MKTKIMVKTQMEIVLPMRPNFIRTPHKDVSVPVADLTDDQLREIGKEWTEALIQKARQRRKEKCRAINKRLAKLG